ncbi:MAG: flagellar hook capping FlgD N-terminal domain-containing protein [Pseudomonadota bacterium]
MDITQTATQNTNSLAQPLPDAQNAAESVATQITSDFEVFLRMLTAQMQYQDPLNPIDSTDYATQLATFSGVEQAVKTNELLTTLTTQMGGGSLADMAALVGKEALAVAPARFDGAPLTLTPPATVVGDSRTLVVTDAQGREVSREQIPVAAETITWAGVGPGGVPLPSGLYSFRVETSSLGDVIANDPIPIYSRVTEVRFDDGQTTLVLESGASVGSDQVTALRDPA